MSNLQAPYSDTQTKQSNQHVCAGISQVLNKNLSETCKSTPEAGVTSTT